MSPLKEKQSRVYPIISFLIVIIFFSVALDYRITFGRYPSFFMYTLPIITIMSMLGLAGTSTIRYLPRLLQIYSDWKASNNETLVSTIISTLRIYDKEQPNRPT